MENLIFYGKGLMHLWLRGNNAFFLREVDGTDLPGGPVHGRMLKNYYSID